MSRPSSIYKDLQSISRQLNSNNEQGICCGDLSALEVWALEILSETDKCSIQQLAKGIHYTISGATRLVNRLEKRAYVERYRSPEDGRVCCVKTTAKASTTLTEIEDKARLRIQTALDEVPTGERQQFAQYLRQFCKGLERP